MIQRLPEGSHEKSIRDSKIHMCRGSITENAHFLSDTIRAESQAIMCDSMVDGGFNSDDENGHTIFRTKKEKLSIPLNAAQKKSPMTTRYAARLQQKTPMGSPE